MQQARLTELAGGGGCGCKVAPAVLAELLAQAPSGASDERLLVGNETSDDCAAYLVNPAQVVVASADFFMPIVDDPFVFGQIAATNALSDIYAMGATPLFALALAGMPLGKLSSESIGRIFAGGARACADAGIAVAGGHTIDAAEPIYGLAASGLCAKDALLRNSTARAGDVLLLTKPLGVGVLAALANRGKIASEDLANLVATTTRPNAIGATIGSERLASAMTDVTGFGLLGHLLELCRASGLDATIEFARIELLPNVARYVREGFVTGASGRNWKSYGEQVELGGAQEWQRDLLCDPQTSGGLLIATAPGDADRVIALADGAAKVIGSLARHEEARARITLRL